MNFNSPLFCLVALVTSGLAQAVDMKTAAAFGALAPRSINSTGNTAIIGSVGIVSDVINGFPPGTLTGALMAENTADNAAVFTAISDANNARIATLALTPTKNLTTIGGGITLTPGVYAFEKQAVFSGSMTLDGDGAFIFQGISTLTVEANSEIILKGGASAEKVFWALQSTAVFQNDVVWKGGVMAGESITVGESTAINGGLYSDAFIDLDDNKVGLVTSS